MDAFSHHRCALWQCLMFAAQTPVCSVGPNRFGFRPSINTILFYVWVLSILLISFIYIPYKYVCGTECVFTVPKINAITYNNSNTVFLDLICFFLVVILRNKSNGKILFMMCQKPYIYIFNNDKGILAISITTTTNIFYSLAEWEYALKIMCI